MTRPLSPVIIIGGGFTGLSAALELVRAGQRVVVLEKDEAVGGLAGSFSVGKTRLEKFYHHWFTNDVHVHQLVKDIGKEGQVVYRPTRTGSYYANSIFRLSKPLDLLRYTPLSFWARIRLGMLVLQAKLVRDWRALEQISASEWLIRQSGREVYDKVWQPLLRGKFGAVAEQVAAIWIWNKLVLRGGSRSKNGDEMLAYYTGGFAALADAVVAEIERLGGVVRTSSVVTGLEVEGEKIKGVRVGREFFPASNVIATIPLPLYRDLVTPHVSEEHRERLSRIQFLGNICLTLELSQPLSSTYWINVADPDFPFVGLIEHTNFEPAESYAGRHIVYLSKYLPTDAALYQMSADELLAFATPYIKKMFPEFRRSWVLNYHLYKAEFSQPIVSKGYSNLIPPVETPIKGLWLSTMAQIYPEDRGTNYAIREGRKLGSAIAERLKSGNI